MTTVCSPSKSNFVKTPALSQVQNCRVEFLSSDELAHLHDNTVPIYLDAAYLKAVSCNDSHDLIHIFPVVYFNDELLAHGAFCLLKRHKKESIRGFVDQGNAGRILKQTVKAILPLLFGTCEAQVQFLIAGNMLVSGPYGLHFHRLLDQNLQSRIWKETLSAVDKKYGEIALTVLKDFPVDSAANRFDFPGFFKVNSLPVMQLTLRKNWYGFDHYLDAMSAKYRIRVKAALNKAQGLTTEYWEAADIEINKVAIHALYSDVYKRAKFRIQPVSEDYFTSLAKEIPNKQFRFIAWKDAGRLIGFSSAFYHNGRLDAHLIGMDYAYNRSHSLYLNMIYRYVQDGILLRAELVDFGRTAMEIKSTAGAEPYEQDVLLKLRSGVANRLASRFVSKLDSEPWIQRHPFKASK
jgi:hypothetical protein